MKNRIPVTIAAVMPVLSVGCNRTGDSQNRVARGLFVHETLTPTHFADHITEFQRQWWSSGIHHVAHIANSQNSFKSFRGHQLYVRDEIAFP